MRERGIRILCPVSSGIMLACRRFYEIVLSTPSLHSSIPIIFDSIYGGDIANAVDVDKLLLRCGTQQALTLSIATLANGADGEEVPNFADAPFQLRRYATATNPTLAQVLQQTRHRLKSITFLTNCSEFIDLVRHIHSSCFPSLREVNALQPWRVFQLDPRILDMGVWAAPLLSKLVYHGAQWDVQGLYDSGKVGWDTLEEVDFVESARHWGHMPDIARGALRLGTQLRVFRGEVEELTSDATTPADQIRRASCFASLHHARLQSLQLAYWSPPDHDADEFSFFTNLSTPSLQHLAVDFINDQSSLSPPLLSFIRNHPNITSLELTSKLIRHEVLFDVLHSLPGLLELTIGNMARSIEEAPCDEARGCDGWHPCDHLLAALADSTPLVPSTGAPLAWSSILRMFRRAELVEMLVCPRLKRLTLLGSQVSRLGLKAFLHARGMGRWPVEQVDLVRSLVLDAHELHDLKIELLHELGVHLNGTSGLYLPWGHSGHATWLERMVEQRDRLLDTLSRALQNQAYQGSIAQRRRYDEYVGAGQTVVDGGLNDGWGPPTPGSLDACGSNSDDGWGPVRDLGWVSEEIDVPPWTFW